jgi:hypothetical protein
MIACEYFFKEFYSRGSDEYLNQWAAQVDRMSSEGWQVLDSKRRAGHPGFWTVVLVRPPHSSRDSGIPTRRSERWNRSGYDKR